MEILSPKIFSQSHPSIRTLLTLRKLESLPAADRLNFFMENWKKLTNDPSILKVVQGYQIPLLTEPTQFSSPSEIQMKLEEQIVIDQDVGKTSSKISTTLKISFSEYTFPSCQKRHRTPSSDQF